MNTTTNKGFTLIEVLVVIGIIAILAAIVIVSINPAKRFQDANTAQRQANVEAIMSALQQNIIDNKGTLSCTGLTSTLQDIGTGKLDLTTCLNPYLAIIPTDPDGGTPADTLYQVSINASNQITVESSKDTTIKIVR